MKIRISVLLMTLFVMSIQTSSSIGGMGGTGDGAGNGRAAQNNYLI